MVRFSLMSLALLAGGCAGDPAEGELAGRACFPAEAQAQIALIEDAARAAPEATPEPITATVYVDRSGPGEAGAQWPGPDPRIAV